MKKCFFALLMIALSLNAAYAGKLVITKYPTATGIPDAEVAEQFNKTIAELNKNAGISKLGKQNNLAKGMANANASCYSGGSLYTNTDMNVFSYSLGLSLGGQWPEGGTDELKGIVNDEGDAYTGIGWNTSFVNIGISGKKINGLPQGDKMFAVIKMGGFSQTLFEGEEYEVGLKNRSFGFNYYYNLQDFPLKDKNFSTRPLAVGIGLHYISNVTSMQTTPNQETTTEGAYVATYKVNTTNKLSFDSYSVVIPVDVMTSAKAVGFINLFGGTGLDFAFGSTEVGVNSTSKTSIVDSSGKNIQTTEGKIKLSSGTTTSSPMIVNPKVVIGFGVDIVGGKFEIPFTYYPARGMSIGMTFGYVM